MLAAGDLSTCFHQFRGKVPTRVDGLSVVTAYLLILYVFFTSNSTLEARDSRHDLAAAAEASEERISIRNDSGRQVYLQSRYIGAQEKNDAEREGKRSTLHTSLTR